MAIDDSIGLVRLGLAGKTLARRLTAAGWRVVGRDPDRQAGEAAQAMFEAGECFLDPAAVDGSEVAAGIS